MMINKLSTPDLEDVDPGSDADETPIIPVGETPSNPNDKSAPVDNDQGGLQDDDPNDEGNKKATDV